MRRAKAFFLVESELYKQGAAGILMQCILGDQGKELLCEIHAGTCGHHVGLRTLVGKAFRQGFYWPTTVADSKDIVRRCKGCSTLDKLISQRRFFKPSPSHGLLPSGTSTWWRHSDKHLRASRISS
jgi:hypothetical protein